MHKRKQWCRFPGCQRTLICFAFAVGILNLAVNTKLKNVENVRMSANGSNTYSIEELRKINEVLVEDSISNKKNYEDVVHNLARDVYSLRADIAILRDAREKFIAKERGLREDIAILRDEREKFIADEREKFIAKERDFNKQLFESNARYREAETNYEIARSKESSLKDQIEAAGVREKKLISRIVQLQRGATPQIKENDVQLRLDTAPDSHQHLRAALSSTLLPSASTDSK
jgi:hypothetical protein